MTPDAEKMLAEMYLNQQRMMEEIRALRAQIQGHPAIVDGWMRTKEAAIALKSEGVLSDKHLRKLVSAGVFSESNGEIKNRSNGDRATWYYHIPSCRKALRRHFRRI
jgi:lipopolysaccharide biosynthesis regulator YciM